MKRSQLIFWVIIGSAIALIVLAMGIRSAIDAAPHMIEILRAPQEPEEPEFPRPVPTTPRGQGTPIASPTEDTSEPIQTFSGPRVSLVLPEAEVRDVTTFSGYSRTVIFLGEVVNTGQQGLQSPLVHLVLYDDAGAKLDVVTGRTEHDLVPPGAVVPFKVYLSNPPPNWTRFEIIYRPQAADGSEYMAYTDFESLEDQSTPDDDYPSSRIISGRVRNTGRQSVRFVQAIISIYNTEEQIIGMADIYLNGLDDRMAPNQVLPFEARLSSSTGEEIVFYRVQFVANVPDE